MKPTEVRLVAELLEKDYGSAVEAAEAVIGALDAKRAKDAVWVGVALIPIGETSWVRLGRGPFSTKLQAERDAASLVANYKPGGPGSFFAVKLRKDVA